jgi:hypothetical protein
MQSIDEALDAELRSLLAQAEELCARSQDLCAQSQALRAQFQEISAIRQTFRASSAFEAIGEWLARPRLAPTRPAPSSPSTDGDPG